MNHSLVKEYCRIIPRNPRSGVSWNCLYEDHYFLVHYILVQTFSNVAFVQTVLEDYCVCMVVSGINRSAVRLRARMKRIASHAHGVVTLSDCACVISHVYSRAHN